jgi:hypothetical protein
MRKLWYVDRYRYVIASVDGLLPARPTCYDHLRPGSYASALVQRVLDLFYGELVDARQEYGTYYLDDYRTFEQYLVWKQDIPEEWVDEICGSTDGATSIGIGSFSFRDDYTLQQLVRSEDSRTFLSSFFDLRNAENEVEN